MYNKLEQLNPFIHTFLLNNCGSYVVLPLIFVGYAFDIFYGYSTIYELSLSVYFITYYLNSNA